MLSRIAIRARKPPHRRYATQPQVHRRILSTANEILRMSDPELKASTSIQFHAELSQLQLDRNDILYVDEPIAAPEKPSRPEKPQLVTCVIDLITHCSPPSPLEMPGHKKIGVSLPNYLLHSLARRAISNRAILTTDIELNAIDTCWDTILRFYPEQLPLGFVLDFVSIANDESRHFNMLCTRLKQRGAFYGMIPAHSGIWDAADNTKHNLKARLTVIQLVQEPRALDSWERLIAKFRSQQDVESAKIIDTICGEEVDHVKKGVYWFKYLCEREGLNPIETFHQYGQEFGGLMCPPYNSKARDTAGLTEDWYMPISVASLRGKS